jgi:hypothetical protein
MEGRVAAESCKTTLIVAPRVSIREHLAPPLVHVHDTHFYLVACAPPKSLRWKREQCCSLPNHFLAASRALVRRQHPARTMVRMTADVVLGAPSRISPTEDWELHLRSESWSVRTLRSLTRAPKPGPAPPSPDDESRARAPGHSHLSHPLRCADLKIPEIENLGVAQVGQPGG